MTEQMLQIQFSQAIANYTQALTAKQPILSAQGQQGAIYTGLQTAQNDYAVSSRLGLYPFSLSPRLDVAVDLLGCFLSLM